MAIGDDFTINASGDIRADTPGSTYTVLELHRWLQDLADNASTAGGADDILDITSATPSERSTDEIITLINGYNIDDTAAEWFYGGSIKQGSGATEVIYSGLRCLGSVVSSATQIQVVQDKILYDGASPFWGTQASPFNGGGNVLFRILVKSREYGADIDQSQIRVQARHYGDTYASFDVTLGEGEAVAAISTVDDPQNNTAQGTVDAYTHVTNTEGFQQIDIGDGNGNQPYYSKWTYGADTSGDQLKAVWEWAKNETRTGATTSSALYWVDGTSDDLGENFRGITHTYSYDNLSGSFTEDNTVVWGTEITYDGLSGGTFSEGDYVRIGTSGAAGRVMYDNGSNFMMVALEDTSITLLDDDVITEASAGTVTASINVTITNNDKEGGSGELLANDASGTKHHIEIRTGAAPVDNIQIRDGANTCDVAGSVTARTITPVFLGSYVGTLIGGFGVGVDSDDLTSSDTVTDLDGDINTPPNNVTWTLSGLVAGDRVLVGPKDTGDDFEFDQMTLAVTLNGATETVVDVGTGNIPDNTPAAGTLRVTLDDGRIRYVEYDSHDGDDEFTLDSGYVDWQDPDDATLGNSVMLSYIDKAAATDEESYTTIYTSPQTLWVRVRDGGGTPIKTYEGQSSLSSTGGAATASRISDA